MNYKFRSLFGEDMDKSFVDTGDNRAAEIIVINHENFLAINNILIVKLSVRVTSLAIHEVDTVTSI